MLLSAEHSSSGRSRLQLEAHPLRIAKEFSETPFGRYVSDGDESGEVFREEHVIPALEQHDRVKIILDGVDGLPSSFWEEVMGGLVRRGFTVEQLRERLSLETADTDLKIYVRLGWKYAQEAADTKH